MFPPKPDILIQMATNDSDFHKIPDKEAKRVSRISSKNVKEGAKRCLEEFKDGMNNLLNEFQETHIAEWYKSF